MSIIRMNAQCIDCLLNKYIGKIPPNTDEQTALAYKKGILRLLADAPDTMSAPEVVAQATTYKNATFGFSDDYAEIKRDIEIRDHLDSTRAIAPLKKAEDAVLVDTSDMTIEEVVNAVVAEYHRAKGEA